MAGREARRILRAFRVGLLVIMPMEQDSAGCKTGNEYSSEHDGKGRRNPNGGALRRRRTGTQRLAAVNAKFGCGLDR
jgi:hypothetical protein